MKTCLFFFVTKYLNIKITQHINKLKKNTLPSLINFLHFLLCIYCLSFSEAPPHKFRTHVSLFLLMFNNRKFPLSELRLCRQKGKYFILVLEKLDIGSELNIIEKSFHFSYRGSNSAHKPRSLYLSICLFIYLFTDPGLCRINRCFFLACTLST